MKNRAITILPDFAEISRKSNDGSRKMVYTQISDAQNSNIYLYNNKLQPKTMNKESEQIKLRRG